MDKKIVLGLSGGVDSAVTAYLLQQQGYSVHGLLLKVPFANSPIEDAKAVADSLGVPLEIVDVESSFTENIIRHFCKEYERGATPNPCVVCNPLVKFKILSDFADKIGAAEIATGHYVGKRRLENGRHVLIRELGNPKDQSYMLHRLSSDVIARTCFPLFGMDKSEVRQIANEAKIPVAAKKDSQEICFIPDNDYEAFLEKNKVSSKLGNFIDINGAVLGAHRGICSYTVGQRKRLGISAPTPLYVKHIDDVTGDITLCEDSDLFSNILYVEDVVTAAFDTMPKEFMADVKIRFSKNEARAKVECLGDGQAKVTFDTAVRAPTKGQYAVFYDGEILLGGGRIK